MKKKQNQRVDRDEDIFRRIVDATCPTLTGPANELEALYSHFDLADSDTLRRSAVTDHLYALIKHDLTTGNDRKKDLRRLRRQVVLRHLADNAPLEPYYAVIQVLQDAAKTYATSLNDLMRWRTAIAAAKDFLLISPDVFSTQERIFIRRRNVREAAMSEGIKALRTVGYAVSVIDGRPSMTRLEEKRVASEIERRVAQLGGIDIADRVFRAIRHSYDPIQERHHIVRNASTTVKIRPAAMPWAYLLNLAAKYPTYIAATANSQAQFEELKRLATAFGTTFDAEPFSAYELLFHSGRGLPAFLTSIATYDGMFTLRQFRPKDMKRVLRGLLGWVPIASVAPLGFTFQEAFTLADGILDTCRAPGPVILSASMLERKTGLNTDTVNAILPYFAHGERGPNVGYVLPNDQTQVDFELRPLVTETHGEYLVFDRSWCCSAFYEALASVARQVEPQTDNRIGLAFEKHVRAELARCGISFSTGDYKTTDGHAECDLVVETNDVIMFIELKKKVLTRSARAGSDVAIFLDLTKSMFDAQIQLSRHELALYKNGSLQLTKDGVSTRLERKDREVERIALGLLDFGGLQDRLVMTQILETMVGFDLVAVSKQDAARVEQVHQRAVVLRELLSKLEKYRPHDQPFFSSWFLSLGQLMVLLDGVEGNEAFKDALFLSRHVSMSTLDFYFEHHMAQDFKRRAAGKT